VTVATTYYFIESPHGPTAVLDWLRRQDDVSQEFPKDGAMMLCFRGAGQLGRKANGEFDVSLSPLVTVVPPKVRRGALWSVGEVHFLAKNAASTFPLLDSIRRRFEKWLGSHPIVFDQGDPQGDYAYYLEGSIRNIAPKVFALPSGLDAIKSEQYFIAHDDNDFVLDRVCQALRLRGIECQ